MKKNGVAIQCIIHNPLAKAPIASNFISNNPRDGFFSDIIIDLIIINIAP